MTSPRAWQSGLLLKLTGLVALTCVAGAQERPAQADEPPAFRVSGGVRYHDVNFYRLSGFNYPIVDASTGATAAEIEAGKKQDKIPAAIRFYDGKAVALTGFMLPITLESGLATKFILMRDTNTCCYGNVPNINEFVIVTMKGKGVRPVQDIPVTLLGTFHILERYDEGYLLPIFEMTGDRLLD